MTVSEQPRVERVLITEAAARVVDTLRAEHGALMFHQSGGCCDGSAPMCFAVDDFKLGSRDLYLGEVHGCGFYMNTDQFEYYKNCQTTIDVVSGRGASFSLEIPLGLRFLTTSRLFEDSEQEHVRPVEPACA